MLSKDRRLIKTKDISQVFRSGLAAGSNELQVKAAKNGLAISRFTVVVSLQVDKRATRRNRLKRRLREIIKLHLNSLKDGYDVVVITRRAALAYDYWQLEKSLLALLQKLRLFK